MTQPLSWTWVVQALLLVFGAASAVGVVAWAILRKRPLQVHVLKHEVNKTWEEVKAEIEAKNPEKTQWQYTEAAKERGFKEEEP